MPRFGYNGMLKDNEFKGEGNSYTTEFRFFDPRVGRWWSLDPKPSASESWYAGMGNNPILMMDPLGDREWKQESGTSEGEQRKSFSEVGGRYGEMETTSKPLDEYWHNDKWVSGKVYDKAIENLGRNYGKEGYSPEQHGFKGDFANSPGFQGKWLSRFGVDEILPSGAPNPLHNTYRPGDDPMYDIPGIVGIGKGLKGLAEGLAKETAKGWKVGDPITNLTSKGKTPSWNTIRQRYWKNEAYNNAKSYKTQDIPRLKKGLAPQRYNEAAKKMESMHLHHDPPQSTGNLFKFKEMEAWEHRLYNKNNR
jgi:RHS repeat-associated protein